MTPDGPRVVMLLENNPYPEDTRVRNEAESLAAAGYGVTVVAPRADGQRARTQFNGVHVRRYHSVSASDSLWSYLLEYLVAHVQLIRIGVSEMMSGARVVHFHAPPDTLFVAGVLARAARRDVVYDFHDSGPELFAAKFGSSPIVGLLRLAQRFALRVASTVIVTNESQLELARTRGGRRLDEVVIVRNGPRGREFDSAPPPRVGVLTEPRLIYVGALDVQDGVLELAELLALPALAAAKLTIVGDGPVRGELERRCAAAGIGERVTLAGQVPHADVASLIRAADIGIDPAPGTPLNHGSTMIKITEYVAAGRPVVAYDLRETRRTAEDAAVYAPCDDIETFASLIGDIAGNEDLRARLAEAARRRSKELMWERSEDALLALYSKLGREGAKN